MAKRRFRSRGRFRRVRRRGLRAKRLRKFIKRTVNRMQEVKYTVDNTGIATPDNAVAILNINPDVPQGVSKDARIGLRIRSRKLTVKWSLQISSGVSTPQNAEKAVRILILQQRVAWTSPSVLFSDFTDLSTDWQTTIKGVNARVLFDSTRNLVPALSGGGNPTQIGMGSGRWTAKKYFRINNNVNYPTSAALAPTDPKDLYWFVVLTNNYLGTANAGQIIGTIFVRHSFTDM